MFAKVAIKHPEKYPRFNKFSLLHTDSLDSFDTDNSCNTPISVPVAVDSSGSLSSISYKTSNGSTISTSRTCKNSISSRSTMQKLAVVTPVLPISVLRDSTPILPRADSTPLSLSIYDSVSACYISEIAPGANHFRIQIYINEE